MYELCCYICATFEWLSSNPEARLCKISITLLRFSICTFCFISCRERSKEVFLIRPHLDQISSRFLVDHKGDIWGLRSLFTACFGLSLCGYSCICSPGKGSTSHRWATSDPNWLLYLGIISHLRACMQWVIVTVNHCANVQTETSD